MITSKYLGKVYEGRWKVVKYRYNKCHYYYTLENIYNKQEIELSNELLVKIDRGEKTISKLIAFRLVKDKKNKRGWNDYYSNSHQRRLNKIKELANG